MKSLEIRPHMWNDDDGRFLIAVSVPQINYLSPSLVLEATTREEAQIEGDEVVTAMIMRLRERLEALGGGIGRVIDERAD